MSDNVFMCANGQSTERNIAEAIMLELGLNNHDFRARDPLVLLVGRRLEEERQAAAKARQAAAANTPTATSLLPLLRSLQTYPHEFQELIRRMLLLSQATHSSARCLLEHGEAGLSSVDNVSRLIADLQLSLRELKLFKSYRVWQVPSISRDVHKHAKHNRRKLGPVCRGCQNWIGFYLRNEFLGTTPLFGQRFLSMKPGDRLELGGAPARVLTVERIEGLMVHLREPDPEQSPADSQTTQTATEGSPVSES